MESSSPSAHGHRCPSTKQPLSPPAQRGIYSEVLRTPSTSYAPVTHSRTPSTSYAPLATRARCLGSGQIPVSANLPTGDFRSFPFVSAALKTEKLSDVANVKPKVLEAYSHGPARAPRKVTVERKRRLYASLDIEKLLIERNIDCRNASAALERWLPLEPFDDTTYDDGSPEEWIGMCYGVDGAFLPLAAQCLTQDGDGDAKWYDCQVVGYDGESKKFAVQIHKDGSQIFVPRLNLLFKAEDPVKFANRIAAAHLSRQHAESLIQYNYYIDNMPITNANGPSAEQVKRIAESARQVASKWHRHISTSTVEVLLAEFNLLFARTMNKIAFDKRMNKRGDDIAYRALIFPPKLLGLPPKKMRLHPQPPHILYGQFQERIRMQLLFFQTVKLEEFKQIQRSHLSQLSADLQETWAQNICRVISAHLSGVGKGWFNLHETSKETYECGKTKKLLIVASLLMQDSLRQMTMQSLEEFTTVIEAYAFPPVGDDPMKQVKDMVACATSGHKERAGVAQDTRKGGMFALDLTRGQSDNIFQFNLDPELFLKAILDVFEKGLLQMGQVPHPEKLVLPHLFKNHPKHVLASMSVEETCVQDCRRRLKRAVESHFPYLKRFLKTFEEYKYILELKPEDVAQQAARRVMGQSGTTHLREAINDYLMRVAALETSLPNYAVIGAFRVNCFEIKKHLAHKLQQVANLSLDVLARRFRDRATQTLDQFKGVSATLKKRPRNIEEVTELQAFLSDIPSTLERLKLEIKGVTNVFETLEQFGYKFYVEDHALRWKLYGSPSEIILHAAEVDNVLQKDRQIFLEDMLCQQAEFAASLQDLESLVEAASHYEDVAQLEEINAAVLAVSERLSASVKMAKVFNNKELLFGTTVTDYSRVHRLVKDLEPIVHLWSTASAWSRNKVQWLEGPFVKIDPQLLQRQVYGGIQVMHKVRRAVDDRQLESIREHAATLLKELEEFSPLVSLIIALRNDGMRMRHWDKISTAVGKKIWPGMEDFTLNKLIELQIADCADIIVETGEVAAREFSIEKALKKMKSDWEKVTFSFKEKYKLTDTYILKGTDEIIALFDEHIALTQTLQFSPDKKPFEEEIEEWYRELLLASETLDEWLKCQRAWMHLQPLFDSPDIVKQLASETKRFRSVDAGWRVLMRHSFECPLALSLCLTSGLVDKLRDYNANLEKAQHGLESYLDVKRSQFSRFYFLSNEELLGLLSETKDPRRVQPYLCKVFENVEGLIFEDTTTATALYSAEGEKLLLTKPLLTQDKPVESWMTDLEHIMRKSVRGALLHAITSYVQVERSQWMLQHPAQCVLCGSQIHYAANVEAAIMQNSLSAYLEELNSQLLQLVALMRLRPETSHSITLGALIVIDVHAKDVVERLRDGHTQSLTAFEWISQLRYCWREEGCYVQCVQTDLPYGYEYLGNTSRLVLTPLTDMAYMTLMGAQLLNLGGALTGPAGTGKTETTKDLAKAVGRQCVVFNCSDTMDYLMLSKFCKGVASSGAWCCFDEFNRINVEVLSVVAQHLLVLFGAKAQASSFTEHSETEFDGSQITVSRAFNVFVTMNPGYPGRSELPDNLKSLFRPMAMMIPDYTMIGEIMLYSFGFNNARQLSKKMIATFKLASEQLSACDHYDYGMRAVRSVINAAGMLKRAQPQVDEYRLLVRALKDVNMPKFLTEDLVLFENIIGDLFPGIKGMTPDHKMLADAIHQAALDQGLQPIPAFVAKAVQLYDTMQVRHGIMLIGPTGGGKTSCYRTLASAIGEVDARSHIKSVHLHTLNPKALTIGQLYGEFNELTHEWKDGVVAVLLRQAVHSTSDDRHWILFDGPVDAFWIESMNSVLDDNKRLCLNSGETILLKPQVTVMFEAEDLCVASPATVSRCGMVYMEPSMLEPKALITSWLQKLPCTFEKQHRKSLDDLLSLLPEAIEFIREHAKEAVRVPAFSLLASCLRLLECLFAPFVPEKTGTPSNELLSTLEAKLLPAVVVGLTWSVGAVIDAPSRLRFSDWLLHRLIDKKAQSSCIPFPENAGLYDVYFDMHGPGKWMQWAELDGGIGKFVIPKGASYERIVVPSIESQRMIYLLKLLSSQRKHVLCSGGNGTGKSVNITECLCARVPEDVEAIIFAFSAQTHVNQAQELLEMRLEKRRRGVIGPPAGKRFVIFIDDFNMPRRQEFGAQPPLELLRQWLDHRGWYNRKSLSFVEVIDTTLIAGMAPAAGGHPNIPARLIRHFNVLAQEKMEDQSVYTIFSNLLLHFFDSPLKEIREVIVRISKSSVDVYNSVVQKFLPTPSRMHYTFNLRDLWKAIQGMTLLGCKKDVSTGELVSCWVHENMRVFGDRLIDEEERSWLKDILHSTTEKQFGVSMEQICPTSNLIFTDFCGSRTERLYQQVLDLQQWKRVIEEFLEEYNILNSTPLNLVLFSDACEHVTRVCRILRQPLGHALLLGVRGSGRQSLSRLACAIMDCEVFSIEATKGYTVQEWREDLKTCLLSCGLHEKRKTILLEDGQFVLEQMLEDIYYLLSYADIPLLYKKEELEEILTTCKWVYSPIDVFADYTDEPVLPFKAPVYCSGTWSLRVSRVIIRNLCKPHGLRPTRTNIFNEYLKRIQANIHVILVWSPMTDQFRTRLRMYPALTTCCTIDWFSEWPTEALISVAQAQLEQARLSLPDESRAVDVLQFIHVSAQDASSKLFGELRKQVFVTPTTFFDLISSFVSIHKSKQLELATTTRRLQIGLDKLEEAARQVEAMQQQLHEWQPVLVATSQEIETKMAQIQQDRALADETKVRVGREESEASEKAVKTQALKDEAQRELDEALPALDEAVECLKKLKAEHVREVKALTKPPAGVLLTMEAVCIMFQVPPVKKVDPTRPGSRIEDFWESAQHRLLKEPKKLLDDLLNYDKMLTRELREVFSLWQENIPETVITKIAPYIDRQDFDPAAIRKASVACEAICTWVRAMLRYHMVAKAVEPKRVKLKQAEDDLLITMQNLNTTKAKLEAVENKVARLAEEFAIATKKKEQLSAAIQLCQAKVNRAKPLFAGLANEKLRWAEQAEESKGMQAFTTGHALVCAAMVAYAGPFSVSYRAQLRARWLAKLERLAIPHMPGCTLRQFLGCPVKIRQWNLAGLPKDDFSVENGIILDRSRRWPLMIDPQMQATRFIKALGRTIEQGFEVCKITDDNFCRELELAIHFGKWMLVESVTTTLDSFLEPILLQPVLKENQTSGTTVRLGNKLVPWSPNFKLFLTTANPNQNFPPETFVKLTVLNFSITPEGLEEQLLALIVSREAPELEEKKNLFVTNNARMRKELKILEDKILQLLSQSQGDILEDEALVGTLAAAKFTAEEMNKKVEEAEMTEQEIDKARECYRGVARRARLLFFCVSDLANIQYMYQYSLQWFQGLVVAGIDEVAASSRDPDVRLATLTEHLTYLVFENVSRALFGKHRLLFSFLLALKIQTRYSTDPQELRFLLTGSIGRKATTRESVQKPVSWLSEKQWGCIQALSQLPAFSGLEQSICSSPHGFELLQSAMDPLTQPFPAEWNHLTPIQKMCIFRVLRSDKIVDVATEIVSTELGRQYIEHPSFDMARSFKNATSLTPLIFILSPGYDPLNDLSAFAKDIGMGRRLETIALGQGQGPKARKLLEDACSRGGWVLLQNCHVAASWMPELERLCERFAQEEVHRDFRLWLSSMPTQHFPITVLQNGVKIISEPPVGLRANLLRLYGSQDKQVLDGAKKPEIFGKLSFAFSFFHAIVQERKKFGAVGWNVEYEFTVHDLSVCQRQLRTFLDIYDDVPYQILIYLGAHINYGGRVTDPFDKRLIECILKSYVNAQMIEQGSNYKFSSSGTYYCPDADTCADYVRYIQSLPMNAQPEVFGLHENAIIKDLLNGILIMTHHHDDNSGETREQAVAETVRQIAEGLSDEFDVDAIRTKYPVSYFESLNTVLVQEIVRYNGLLRIMRKIMRDLQMAFRGQILLTEELDNAASSIFANVVPRVWSEKSFLSTKSLSSWIQDLHARMAFMKRWIAEGIPICFWLSALFCPQAFLTGVLQNHARKFGIPTDRLTFAYALMDAVDESTASQPPSIGCYVCGIFLEGGHWDSNVCALELSRPKKLFEELPLLWLQPVADREPPSEGVYNCPIYKTPKRTGSLLTTGYSTNHVLTIEIPISDEEDVFIKAGVAGVLSLQD